MGRLEAASATLEQALINVARSASELADNAEPANFHQSPGTPGYLVDAEDMKDLREAIAAWTQASRDALAATQEECATDQAPVPV